MVKEEYYRRWSDPSSVEKFAAKTADDFFASETHFFKEIVGNVNSVLDVGCAAGRFIELLRRYGSIADYTGIDLSEASLERGRATYPDADFIFGNALEVRPGRSFDLVNATGVCQHEPEFERLIRNMLGWSQRYVLFDVKLAIVPDRVVDRSTSFSGSADNRLYYILLNYQNFKKYLLSLTDVSSIKIYGYETRPGGRAVLPPAIDHLVSAGILLEKGIGGRAAVVEEDLPSFVKDEIGDIGA